MLGRCWLRVGRGNPISGRDWSGPAPCALAAAEITGWPRSNGPVGARGGRATVATATPRRTGIERGRGPRLCDALRSPAPRRCLPSLRPHLGRSLREGVLLLAGRRPHRLQAVPLVGRRRDHVLERIRDLLCRALQGGRLGIRDLDQLVVAGMVATEGVA